MRDLQEQTPKAPPPNGNLEELQALLLKGERKRLDKLEDRLIDAPLVANVLPEAIAIAIEKHERPMADKISPLMGPAIRNAVAAALQDMVRYMNRTLDHDLFWRRLTWRWEALSKRKPYWEVALSHSLKYRVEYVFLFFREDGVHLCNVQHCEVLPLETGKEDLVTSMFSAIQTAVQKFSQDEFQVSDDASWRTSEMTDGTTVCIEQGSKAVLAAVVRGVLSPSLRPTFQHALESIHLEMDEALQNFRGDKKPFEAARPHLQACLLHEESDSSKEKVAADGGVSPALAVFLMLAAGSLAWWGITSYLEWRQGADETQRWTHFLDTARKTTGIHITAINTGDGKNGRSIVYGLRDPFSDDPQKIAQEVGLRHEMIDFRLEPYHSLAPQLLRRRLDQLVQEIETHQFDFEAGSALLASESALQTLIGALREGDVLAQQLGHRIRVEIRGNTTEEGAAEFNHRLALARAQGIMSALKVERLPAIDFVPAAEAVDSSVIGENQRAKALRARRVSFHITIDDSGLAGPRL